MPAPRVAHCLFCDDVRFEVGNKLTLVGIYSGDLLWPYPLPGIIPKFAFAVWVISDIGDSPTSLKTSIMMPDGIQLLTAEMLAPPQIQNVEGGLKVAISQIIPVSPLPINRFGMLEVWIETERERLRAGRLRIHAGDNVSETVA